MPQTWKLPKSGLSKYPDIEWQLNRRTYKFGYRHELSLRRDFFLHRTTPPCIYNGGLNTEPFEVWISNGSILDGSVMAITISMLQTFLKPNHWKSEQNGGPFCLDFQWFWTKWPHFCDFTIWIPDTYTVRYSRIQYSDGYWIRVMVWITDHWATKLFSTFSISD